MISSFPSSKKNGWPWTPPSEPSSPEPSGGWPRITIVTPSYNQGPYLEETLRSVLLQRYPNLEYIVIDGGSKDESPALLEKYAPHLSYFQSKPDQGQSDALNQGFSRATGEICAYLNSDDLFYPNTLFHIANHFRETNPYWLASTVDVGTGNSGGWNWIPHITTYADFVATQEFAQPGVFWKRDAAPLPYFPIHLRYAMDQWLFCEIFRHHGPPLVTPFKSAHFRLHLESKTNTLTEVSEREKAALALHFASLADPQTAQAIHDECRRRKARLQIAEWLKESPADWKTRKARFFKAFQFWITDPFPTRDRIFISGALRLLLSLFSFRR